MQPAPDPTGICGDARLVFPAEPAAVRENLARLLACPPLADLPPDDRAMAELVLAEILNNVAEHAYALRPGTVEVALSPGPEGIACLIVDQGDPMPGAMLPAGNLPMQPDLKVSDLPEGGFGWHLIRSLTADLAYVRRNGQNRLSFRLRSPA